MYAAYYTYVKIQLIFRTRSGGNIMLLRRKRGGNSDKTETAEEIDLSCHGAREQVLLVSGTGHAEELLQPTNIEHVRHHGFRHHS